MVFKDFYIFVLRTKVASALEGLIDSKVIVENVLQLGAATCECVQAGRG